MAQLAKVALIIIQKVGLLFLFQNFKFNYLLKLFILLDLEFLTPYHSTSFNKLTSAKNYVEFFSFNKKYIVYFLPLGVRGNGQESKQSIS